MVCHLVNKAVVKQDCIEALNQHAQPLEKKAAASIFTGNCGNPVTLRYTGLAAVIDRTTHA